MPPFRSACARPGSRTGPAARGSVTRRCRCRRPRRAGSCSSATRVAGSSPRAAPRLSRAATTREATLEPDLIVHLGDYLYREAPCPPGNAACAGSPFGYGWEAWNADFFDPARPLLRKAPWVFVRGNHELCKRAGEGWFRFLDGGEMRPCSDTTDPYLVVQGDVQLVVHDSALATDPKAADDQVQIYRRQFESIAAMHPKHAWLVTHRPLWAPALTDPRSATPAPYSYNQTLQAASRNHLPRGIDAVLSGHLHLFEELHFADGRPPQIVAGNGGTSLSPAAYNDPTGITLAGTKVDSGVTMSDFGYFTLDRRKDGAWSGTAFDSESRPRLICAGPVRSLRCERTHD